MKTKTSHLLAVSGLVLALGFAPSASATISFTFDPTGGGGGLTDYVSIDQAPGNALAIGGITAIQNYLAGSGSTQFTLAYQGNLNTVNRPGLDFLNGTGGNFFNFTMQLQEQVTSVSGNTATFGFVSGGTNLFQMFAHTAEGNDLTGAGFGSGTPILTATVAAVNSSSFTNNGGSTNLDNFLGDSWAGQQSVRGSGATDLLLTVLSADLGYFPTLQASSPIVFSFFNTSQVTPFNETDPSRLFPWLNGGTAPSLGTLNGVNGPDFLFQADANQSFEVPEPSALFLMGLGLAGFTLLRKRA